MADVTRGNYRQVVAGLQARRDDTLNTNMMAGVPPGAVFEDGSINGGGVLPGSLADVGAGGYGIDFQANGGRGAIVW